MSGEGDDRYGGVTEEEVAAIAVADVEAARAGARKGVQAMPIAKRHPTIKDRVESLEEFIGRAEKWSAEVEEQLEEKVNALQEALVVQEGTLGARLRIVEVVLNLMMQAKYGTFRERWRARKALRQRARDAKAAERVL